MKLESVTCFNMIWNYDNFSKQNTKSDKIYTLLKKIISPNLIVKKYDILGQLWIQDIKSFETFHLKIPL